jgi:hypothetical protein
MPRYHLHRDGYTRRNGGTSQSPPEGWTTIHTRYNTIQAAGTREEETEKDRRKWKRYIYPAATAAELTRAAAAAAAALVY